MPARGPWSGTSARRCCAASCSEKNTPEGGLSTGFLRTFWNMRVIARVIALLPFWKRLLLTMHETCIACQSVKTDAIVRRNVPERAGGWGFALPARLLGMEGHATVSLVAGP